MSTRPTRADRTSSAKTRCLQLRPNSASSVSTPVNSRTCSQPRSRTRSRLVASLPLTLSELPNLPSAATVLPDRATREFTTRPTRFSKRILRAPARSSRSSLLLVSSLSHAARSEAAAMASIHETILRVVSLQPRSVPTTRSK